MDDKSVCIPNIGPLQRRQRVIGGMVGLVGGAALSAFFLSHGVPRPLRALVFLPFFVSATGFFQARAKTCVALVARRERNLDHGAEPVESETELSQLRSQARSVYLQSFVGAALVSALVMFFP